MAQTGRFGIPICRLRSLCLLLLLSSTFHAAFGQSLAWRDPQSLNAGASADAAWDEDVSFATNGLGVWIAVWVVSGDPWGDDGDIVFARSTNDGVSWSSPIALNSDPLTDFAQDALPCIATDRNGNWIIAWEAEGAFSFDPDIVLVRSGNNGVSWSAPAALNVLAPTDFGNDQFPQIVTNGNGTWIACWQSTTLSNGGAGTDYDIRYARSFNNGETWTAANAINSDANGDSKDDRSPTIASDGTAWIGIWTTPTQVMVSRSTNGFGWSAPLAINIVDEDIAVSLPTIAADDSGNWVAAWTSSETNGGFGFDIIIAQSPNGTAWFPPSPLDSGAADVRDDFYPRLATNGSGAWAVVWESRYRTLEIQESFIGVAYSADDGATWTPPAQLNHAPPPNVASARAPRIALDQAGRWIACWSFGGLGVSQFESDVYHSRQSLDSDDDGVADADESTHGTNPSDNDSDNDGIADGTELWTFGTDPADADSDNDGFIDGLEVDDETDPNDTDDFLERMDVYVQFGATGLAHGTPQLPVPGFAAAIPMVQAGGNVRFLNAGGSNQSYFVDKAMRVLAQGGVVRLGAP